MNDGELPVKIFAVIPCLNEDKFIGDIVNRSLRHVSKVIVVDDASTDDTSKAASEAGAEVIRHRIRSGAGAATRSGFEAALRQGADIVVTLDGDGQHNPDEIPLLLGPVVAGQADFVVGSRFMRQADVPRYRKFGIDVITWLYNAGRRDGIVDAQSGFRACSRRVLEAFDITYPGFGFSIQTLVQARRQGFKIVEVPISCIYHNAGSTQNPVTHGISVACSVIKIRIEEELLKRRAVMRR